MLEAEDRQAVAETEGTGEDEVFDGDVVSEGNRTGQSQAPAGNDRNAVDPAETGSPGQPEPDYGQKTEQIQQQEVRAEDSPVICVHVCGAVKNAGVYELPAGSRVFEAVREAGGFTADADESYVNQAQQLPDGAKLVIPTTEQVRNSVEDTGNNAEQIGIVTGQPAISQTESYGVSAGADDGSSGTASSSDGKVNINTATEAQLCEIPGIGATRAAAIVAYRQETGGFNSTEDIMNVSGIKEGTYAKIKDRIKVN